MVLHGLFVSCMLCMCECFNDVILTVHSVVTAKYLLVQGLQTEGRMPRVHDPGAPIMMMLQLQQIHDLQMQMQQLAGAGISHVVLLVR